jgi:hypothetical protein
MTLHRIRIMLRLVAIVWTLTALTLGVVRPLPAASTAIVFDDLAAMYIKSSSTGSVLSISSINHGTKATMARREEIYQNEWFIVADGDRTGVFRLKNLYSSKVLSDSPDGQVVVKGEVNDDAQRWTLTDIGSNRWLIENAKTKRLLTLRNNAPILTSASARNARTQQWHLTRVNKDYAVPRPKPVNTGRYMLGAEMCNLWDVKTRPDCWNQIKPYPDRKPVSGWFSEGSQKVMDWDIKMAVDHGISYFVPCWFRPEATIGKPI